MDTSLLSVLLSSLVNQASGFLGAGSVPAIMGNRHPSIAPYQTFNTADRPIALAVGNDKQFRLLVSALGLDGPAGDERFSSNALRVRHRDDLCAMLEAEFIKHGADHWYDVLTSVGVPAGPINDMAEAFTFAEKLGLAVTVPVPGSSTPQVANPVALSATPPQYRSAPPRLGDG